MSPLYKKISTFLMLGLLAVSAFFIRLENFKNSPSRTIDEVVFFRMGQQVSSDWGNYNSIQYGQELKASGRELPSYFFKPLYKHPPLFTFLIAFAMKLIGSTSINVAALVVILCGSLLIPLVYLLALEIFMDKRTAILSAIFMWFDPVSTICSQKIWMDTSLCLFSTASVYFFVKALRSDNKLQWWVLSAIMTGLAVNIKYTALLMLAAQWLYILIYKHDLLKTKKLWFLTLITFLMLLPWAIWNLKVYGQFNSTFSEDDFTHLFKTLALRLSVLAAFFASMILLFKKFESKISFTPSPLTAARTTWIIYTALLAILLTSILHSFNMYHLPKTTWVGGLLAQEPANFYLTQLIEFSPLYILSFILLFRFETQPKTPLISVLKLTIAITYIFFIAWGNFQSRYILTAIPALIILASEQIIRWCDQVKAQENWLLRSVLRAGLLLLFCFIIIKTARINSVVSFPNNLCYF
ncbi:MAG: glycosyltransferase family 39 protein [Candidatus Omnitrophica bacterium]|nr:glycosyltransferase family 39 protein [Candidatus Omnitrophota bacterium]